MAYLELKSLHKTFSGRAAVKDLSLSADKGEFVSLLGPSGCGKTTTLRMIAGFEQPDAGEIWVDGRAMTPLPSYRRGMGMVFQNYALFPHMTVWDNVAFGLDIAGRKQDEIGRRVPELLELVGLQDSGRKYPRELSGGQQQRVALARALAIEPRVLLLDEPLSALDAVVRVALRYEIRRIQSALGITTLYVTHDQEEALAISDRVVVMREGLIEQIGAPEAIYAHPATHFVATFIGTMNQLPGTIEHAGRGRVRCGDFSLTVPPAAVAGLSDGQPVTVLIRPEAITVAEVGAEAAAGGNAIRATVEVMTFLGPVTRVSLDARGRRIVADIAAAERGRCRRGDEVALIFPADACRVVAEAGAAGPGL